MHPYIKGKLRELSEARNRVFRGLARNRPLGRDYEDVGLAGEWEFGRWSGLFPKMKVGSDGGWDFEIPVVFTVDVKTSRKGDYLLVEAGKVKADIYVLVHYEEDYEWTGDKEQALVGGSKLLGWCFSSQVKAKPPADTGRGVINHSVPVAELRKMEELEKMMGRFKRG